MRKDETYVHPTALVSSKAHLDSSVWVGPGSVIGEKVTIGKNTRIDAHVYIDGNTTIGSGCRFWPFVCVGTEPQDLVDDAQDTSVKIGDKNIFREFITINRGTAKGGGITSIGSDNYFMAYAHVAHDCVVGNGTVFMHGATLGGHVSVDDFATVGAMGGVHQFCRIGKYAFIGGKSTLTQDVVPFCRVAGERPTQLYGLNAIGLRRRGFTRDRIKVLKGIFKIIFYSDLNTSQALSRIEEEFPPDEDRDEILTFIRSSKRGFVKKPGDRWDAESE
ncbi:MAG: acyl-ACP--UDP-N-acetylglucosamine O-acyltransferase [Candidatus Aminicenantes bacterium]|jgi:UDP-N-acetylglucosamine acyltransferase